MREKKKQTKKSTMFNISPLTNYSCWACCRIPFVDILSNGCARHASTAALLSIISSLSPIPPTALYCTSQPRLGFLREPLSGWDALCRLGTSKRASPGQPSFTFKWTVVLGPDRHSSRLSRIHPSPSLAGANIPPFMAWHGSFK